MEQQMNQINMDGVHRKKKKARAALSFVITAVLLVILFFTAVNTGSLQTGFVKLLMGMFVEYDADVATIWDLRFPRILISMLAGAGIAVAGVLFQAVLKNPLADPGIIGIYSGAGFAAVLNTALDPGWHLFTPLASFAGGAAALFQV